MLIACVILIPIIIAVVVVNIVFWRKGNIRRKKLEENLNPETVACATKIAEQFEAVLKDIPGSDEIYKIDISLPKNESFNIKIVADKAQFFFKDHKKDIIVSNYQTVLFAIALFEIDIVTFLLVIGILVEFL
jgi:flagellar basal body-associated protein FliL